MKLNKKKIKGQTVLETAMVFSAIIFLTFATINFGILFHTRNMATYAAFMSARSYQVFGDQTMQSEADGGDLEYRDRNGKAAMEDEKTLAAVRTAEDIFTCGLPWMSVPKDDELDISQSIQTEDKGELMRRRCQEGRRKYQKLNIGKTLRFRTFDSTKMTASNGRAQDLEKVADGFSENGREPLRYGILNLKYRTPMPFNPMGVFEVAEGSMAFLFYQGLEKGFISSEVFVPVLLNPGLGTGLSEKQSVSGEKDFDDVEN